MENLSVQTQGDEMVIRLNKLSFDKDYLLSMVKRLYVEQLAYKAEISDSIEDIASEINADWWEANGKAFLQDVKR